MTIAKLDRGKLGGTGLSQEHVPQALDKFDESIDALNGVVADDSGDDADISGKANKVSSPTTGNLASLTSTGDIADSGKKAADFSLLVPTPTNGHVVTTNGSGQPTDSGTALSDLATAAGLNAVRGMYSVEFDGVNSTSADSNVALSVGSTEAVPAAGDEVKQIIAVVKDTGVPATQVVIGTGFEKLLVSSSGVKIVQKQAAGDQSANKFYALVVPKAP